MIRNINPEFGMNVEFDSVQEMEAAIHELENLNGGEWMPANGLREGRDYEIIPDCTAPRIWGRMDNAYATIEEAKDAYVDENGSEPSDDAEIALNVYETPTGNRFYRIGEMNDGTNCSWESLESCDNWFDPEWIDLVMEPWWAENEDCWYIGSRD